MNIPVSLSIQDFEKDGLGERKQTLEPSLLLGVWRCLSRASLLFILASLIFPASLRLLENGDLVKFISVSSRHSMKLNTDQTWLNERPQKARLSGRVPAEDREWWGGRWGSGGLGRAPANSGRLRSHPEGSWEGLQPFPSVPVTLCLPAFFQSWGGALNQWTSIACDPSSLRNPYQSWLPSSPQVFHPT